MFRIANLTKLAFRPKIRIYFFLNNRKDYSAAEPLTVLWFNSLISVIILVDRDQHQFQPKKWTEMQPKTDPNLMIKIKLCGRKIFFTKSKLRSMLQRFELEWMECSISWLSISIERRISLFQWQRNNRH